ncbi:MAG TPA: zf-HC2 domain-containing protein [Burkholderiaceae bacterium]|jgi:hypothetical protein|nr:zf-HC2 domain-containing protein [Burkholderiaceae bacterium]
MSLFRLTCRESAKLLLEREQRPLRTLERARLRLHLGICEMCTRFDGQLRIMDRALATWRAYRDGGD